MKRSSLVGHAAEALDRILRAREPADLVIGDFFRARRYLGARDRRVIADMVFDVLRNHDYLAALWHEAFPEEHGAPAGLPLLFVHALALRGDDEASVREGFETLWRMLMRTTPLEASVAAVKAACARFALPDSIVERLALRYSLPRPVVADWVEHFGAAEAEQLCRASNTAAPTSLRANTLRCTVEECRNALAAEGVEAAPGRLSPVALVLGKRAPIAALRTFRQGWFEVQDEGSQLLSLLVDPAPGMTIVDACAGGGGKTLHLAALMKNQGRLVAMDVAEDRLKNLRERAARAGASIAAPALARAGLIDSLAGKADAVLIDAPCSGTGTFRRNPGAKMRFSSEAVAALVRTQRRLLDDYQRMVRPGGHLVYATCSLLRSENEEQIGRFLAGHPDFTLAPAGEALLRQGVTAGDFPAALELLPHRTGTDGFFAAILRRSP